MAHITSMCQICNTPLSANVVVEHAKAHRGTVRVIVAGRVRPARRPKFAIGSRSRRRYLSATCGGFGGLAGFILFGTFLIALLCGALAFWWIRRFTTVA
jgi:hypothetical protein